MWICIYRYTSGSAQDHQWRMRKTGAHHGTGLLVEVGIDILDTVVDGVAFLPILKG